MTRRTAALAVVAGAATWGTTGTAQALADVAASPLAVGAARTVFGALVLFAVAAATRRPATGAAPTGRPLGALVVAGASIAAYQVLFFAGVAATGVAVGTVVGIGAAPVLTGLVAWAADGARPSSRWWGATVLAVAGAVLVLRSSGGSGEVDALGVLLALGAGLSYAVLTVASRRLLDAGVPPTRAMAEVFLVGAVPSAVLLVMTDASSLLSGRGLALVAWLALVTVGAGYVLYARGLREVPPATVGTLTLTEPLIAAVLGILVLAERPSALAVAGMLALATGLVLVVRPAPSADVRSM